MHIQNFQKLAKSNLRRKALLVAEAGYEAINIKKVVKRQVAWDKKRKVLKLKGYQVDFENYKNVYLIGVGKGSMLSIIALSKILLPIKNKIARGVCIDVQIPNSKFLISNKKLKIKFFKGTHPLPSEQNLKATQKLVDLVKNAGKDDLILFFICGGGSALLCGSNSELKSGQKVFKELTSKGANILELNIVRKHLSEVKGGGLAKMAYPATVISLMVSDVLGNDLASIASGPTVYDKSTKKDAERILRKYGLQTTDYRLQLYETIKDKKYFKKVKNILFVSNKDAVDAMAKKARVLGLRAKIYSYNLKGEAKDIFKKLARGMKSGEAAIAGGETVVKLNSKSQLLNSKQILNLKNIKFKIGKGGRNQEAVLGFLNRLQTTDYRLRLKNKKNAVAHSQSTVVMSFASDGHDNNEAAGAIGDILVLKKAEKLGIKPKDYLKWHDSFNFFKKTGDLVMVKKESFNVADLMVILRQE